MTDTDTTGLTIQTFLPHLRDAVWYFARYHWCDNVGKENHWDDS